MSKFPAWFPTYNEVDAFLISRMEYECRHQRITWASYQALAWAKTNTVTDKATILREILEILSPPINWKAMMQDHPTCRSQTKLQFTMTNCGPKKLG